MEESSQLQPEIRRFENQLQVGRLSHYLQDFSTIPGGFLAGFPSTEWQEAEFLLWEFASLKLTASLHLKIDVWNTIVSFWDPLDFCRSVLVSLKEGRSSYGLQILGCLLVGYIFMFHHDIFRKKQKISTLGWWLVWPIQIARFCFP